MDNNRTIAFEVEGLEGDAIVTALVSGEGWKASLSGSTITVTTGEGADESANLVVIATDNKGNSVSYTLRLIHAAYDAESNTYTVYGVAGLQAWGEAANQNLQSNCILAADIILPIPADGESNWTPVGRAGWMYQGTFDGAGHTISNLVVRNQDYGGLIGILETDGTVKNLVLEGASVTGNRSGIVGHNRGRVVGCGSSGQFGSSSMNLTGGIVGSNSGSIIACYSTATVSGIKSGGICGDVTSLSTQTACYWSGNAESAYGDPDEETTSTNVEKVTDNNWDTPMNTMNAKLTDYQWVKNSGGDTNLPLVLEKKESTAL